MFWRPNSTLQTNASCIEKHVLEGPFEEIVLLVLPDGPAFDFEDVEQLVLQEILLLVPEGVGDASPVLVVAIQELNGVDGLVVDEADDKPDVQPPLVLVPAVGEDSEGVVLVPTCWGTYLAYSSAYICLACICVKLARW
jgi:hypothetical protein